MAEKKQERIGLEAAADGMVWRKLIPVDGVRGPSNARKRQLVNADAAATSSPALVAAPAKTTTTCAVVGDETESTVSVKQVQKRLFNGEKGEDEEEEVVELSSDDGDGWESQAGEEPPQKRRAVDANTAFCSTPEASRPPEVTTGAPAKEAKTRTPKRKQQSK